MSDRARLGGRLLEGGLWVAAVLAGGYVLLPAAVDLIQVRRLEEREQASADRAEAELRETGRAVHWLAHDPQALEKLLERQEVGGRTQEGSLHEPADGPATASDPEAGDGPRASSPAEKP